MSDRAFRVVAWTIAGLSLACIPVALVIVVATELSVSQATIFAPVACLTFTMVGGIVAAGAPRNAVGWLLLLIGSVMGAGLITSALSTWDESRTTPFTGASIVALLDGTLWLVTPGFLLPRLMLLFPDGRPPSPRWRVVSWGQWLLLAGVALAQLQPGPIRDYERYDNPIGIGALGFLSHPPPVVGPSLGLLFAALELSAVAAVIVRFRHSRGVERLQMKWIAWAVGLTAALWVANPIVAALTRVHWLEPFSLAGVVLSPIAIGVAVLRYRLYEIDRLVSRTLVYGLLTVLLGAAYVGLVLAGQAITSTFTGSSNLAIAASTLVVAALFLPFRSRVQRFVDRRFYRRRYDAQRTLEGFGARPRDQIDLRALEHDLRGVVTETMQPAHASAWLREARQ
jgi:hypothetical protein